MDVILQLLKTDLGICHNKRDEYFKKLIESCRLELKDKGIIIDENNTADVMLLADYAAWEYRKRTEDVPMAQHLKHRIRNRLVKGRANNVTVT